MIYWKEGEKKQTGSGRVRSRMGRNLNMDDRKIRFLPLTAGVDVGGFEGLGEEGARCRDMDRREGLANGKAPRPKWWMGWWMDG